MNKRTGWENEATTRAINAQPWEPPPGMGEAPMSRLPVLVRRSGAQSPLNHAAWTARRSCRAGAAVDQAELIAELAASNCRICDRRMLNSSLRRSSSRSPPLWLAASLMSSYVGSAPSR